MFKIKSKRIPLFILFGICLLATLKPLQGTPIHPIKVMVSIVPQIQLVKHIGGPFVEVQCMIPPKSNAEFFEPTAKTLVFFTKSRCYFKIGHLPFEKSHLKQLTKLNPSIKVINTSKYIKHRAMNHSHKNSHDANQKEFNLTRLDPHTWLSPKNLKSQINQIYEGLAAISPKNKSFFLSKKSKPRKTINNLGSLHQIKIIQTILPLFPNLPPIFRLFCR